MSEKEGLRIKIYENHQKIMLFDLNESTYSRISINKLKKENIKLKTKLTKLK